MKSHIEGEEAEGSSKVRKSKTREEAEIKKKTLNNGLVSI